MKELEKNYARRIAEEYAPKTASAVIQIKKLDEKVKRPAKIGGYVAGSVFALIAGAGMSVLLTDIGPTGPAKWILGIVLGLIGILLCAINYPVYLKVLGARKKKYAFEILELAKKIEEN